MRTYVVSGNVSYEGSNVLAVFLSEISASNFMLSCVAHDEANPEMPIPTAGDDSWAKYETAYKDWLGSHPAKRSIYDSYSIEYFEAKP